MKTLRSPKKNQGELMAQIRDKWARLQATF
jgi:hypothetical protein